MSDKNEIKFVGRRDAINAFHGLRSQREQKNVLYVEAQGGIGKTRLIQQFAKECQKSYRMWHVSAVPGLETIDFHLPSRPVTLQVAGGCTRCW